MIRKKALRESVLIGSYIGMDRALLLELALRGRFVLIDQPLFTNRDHPERATRVTRTQTRKELAIVYHTANVGDHSSQSQGVGRALPMLRASRYRCGQHGT